MRHWLDRPNHAGNTLRSGDTVANLTGALDYGHISSTSAIRNYRLHPTVPPSFTRVNAATAHYCYILVYDSAGGAVTGGGTLAVDGERLSFGLNAKYLSDGRLQGQTQFQLWSGGRFHSTTLDWLVVSDGRAAYQGVGTVDGAGRYGFLVIAEDGAHTGPNNALDRVRFRIWNLDTSAVVFDNQPGATLIDPLDPARTTTSGGNIVIH